MSLETLFWIILFLVHRTGEDDKHIIKRLEKSEKKRKRVEHKDTSPEKPCKEVGGGDVDSVGEYVVIDALGEALEAALSYINNEESISIAGKSGPYTDSRLAWLVVS